LPRAEELRHIAHQHVADGDTVEVNAAENDEGKPELVFYARPQEPIAVELPITTT
jgi:hypothetical protein